MRHDGLVMKNPSQKEPELCRVLGANLRRARLAAEISQEELAALCGLHRTEISLVELGKRQVRIGTALRVVSVLNISLDGLVSGLSWSPEAEAFVYAEPPAAR